MFARIAVAPPVLILLVVLPIAFLGAAVAAAAPLAALILLVLMAAVMLSTRPQTAEAAAQLSLAVILCGYAFLGRGFAGIGLGGVYVGEVALGLGAIALVCRLTSLSRRFSLTIWLIFAFAALGLARTLPYIGRYGTDAVRDAVVWGYAGFAVMLVATMTPRKADTVMRVFPTFARGFLFWAVPSFILYYRFRDVIPSLPGSDVTILVVKAGDYAVHLAAVAAVLMGMKAGGGRIIAWTTWVIAAAAVASINRGGLLAMSLTMPLAATLTKSRQILLVVGIGLALASAAILFRVEFPGPQGRSISPTQLVENTFSILGTTDDSSLEGTKDWRLSWWKDILSYATVGDYRFTGKGFGINLSFDDGIHSTPDAELRSPHNGHLTILARMGIPGALIWIAMNAAFSTSMLRGFRTGGTYRNLYAIILVYWAAAMINMTFDVYLEGPQGGIWFWSIIGLGLALRAIDNETSVDDRELRAHPPRP